MTESSTPQQKVTPERNRNGVVFVGLVVLGLVLAASACALPFVLVWLSAD
jgi:hypothetical protein